MFQRTVLYKIIVNKSINCPYSYISIVNQSYQTGSGEKFQHMSCKTEYSANSFFPYTIKEWNNLTPEIRNIHY